MKIIQLVIKKFKVTISDEETKILDKWLSDSETNKELFLKLKHLYHKGVNISDLENIDVETSWKKVMQKYDLKKGKRNNLQQLLKLAAIFTGLMILAIYGYNQLTVPFEQTVKSDLDVIRLQFDNGEIHFLSVEDEKPITDAQGNVMGKKEGNKLNYQNSKPEGKLIYNTLTIPFGKRFEITLSDGTLVHLNAGSSLKYPVNFQKGKKREVFLKGEAFFDVSEDKLNSFVVSTSGMDVTVLGTEFNVSAYPEDSFINTVLVEGSVSLTSNGNNLGKVNSPLLLKPGFKAEWDNQSGKANIEDVDTNIYTSWTSGKLIIKNLPFKNIIKRLERNFNVTIENNYKELDEQVYTASFNDESIVEVLSSFAENKKFDFIIDGKKIMINQP